MLQKHLLIVCVGFATACGSPFAGPAQSEESTQLTALENWGAFTAKIASAKMVHAYVWFPSGGASVPAMVTVDDSGNAAVDFSNHDCRNLFVEGVARVACGGVYEGQVGPDGVEDTSGNATPELATALTSFMLAPGLMPFSVYDRPPVTGDEIAIPAPTIAEFAAEGYGTVWFGVSDTELVYVRTDSVFGSADYEVDHLDYLSSSTPGFFGPGGGPSLQQQEKFVEMRSPGGE